jgi:UDP-N-acetylmuramate dehydrogenase
MKRYTTLKVGGKADLICYPPSGERLQRMIRYLDEQGLSFLVIGRGSNLLVRDGGIRVPVIRLAHGFGTIREARRHGGDVLVAVGAGATVAKWIRYCVREGLKGSEFLSGIPGSIGGALSMNAGAVGKEIKDITESITYMTRRGGIDTKDRDDLRFGYRSVHLPPRSIVLKATFRLKQHTPDAVRRTVSKNMKWRLRHFPLTYPCAGSVFLNPEGLYAGKLIDEAGLKGAKMGNAQISKRHANFIVNLGGATSGDVLNLMALAQKRVFERAAIRLTPEVKIIGDPPKDP